MTPFTLAVRRLSARHALDADWLNDRATPYWPADADYEDCTTAHVAGGLTVRVPSARVIFLMKLYRAHPQDYEDMVLLWPHCDFDGPAVRRQRSGGRTREHRTTSSFPTTSRGSRAKPGPPDDGSGRGWPVTVSAYLTREHRKPASVAPRASRRTFLNHIQGLP